MKKVSFPMVVTVAIFICSHIFLMGVAKAKTDPHVRLSSPFNSNSTSQVRKVIQEQNSAYWLKKDGTLWGAGYMVTSSLANTELLVSTSTPVLLMTDVVDVYADGGVLAVKSNGDLWGWRFTNSQLEVGPAKARLLMADVASAKFISGDGLLILLRDGTLWVWGAGFCENIIDSSDEPVQILSNVVSYSVASGAVLIVDSKKQLWGWGQNDNDQLLPVKKSLVCKPQVLRKGVTSVAVDNLGSFYVQKDGTLIRQGTNEVFYLSDEAWNKNYAPVTHEVKAKKVKDVKSRIFYSFRSVDDKLWGRFYVSPAGECIDTTKTMGRDATQIRVDESLDERELDYYFKNKGVTFLVMEDVAEYSIDGSQMIVVKKDGTVWGCGDNIDGQLGLGDTEPRRQFTQIHLPPTPENAKGVFDE